MTLFQESVPDLDDNEEGKESDSAASSIEGTLDDVNVCVEPF